MHDLVIKGGTVIDGTGAPARTADVAIEGGRIVEVGSVDPASAARVVDADGALVTPGFVDIHTHYDGQATWEERLIPSAWHGVTTVVMGNCGVGFAPVRKSDRNRLVELMEGVEDIPGTALHEGLRHPGPAWRAAAVRDGGAGRSARAGRRGRRGRDGPAGGRGDCRWGTGFFDVPHPEPQVVQGGADAVAAGVRGRAVRHRRGHGRRPAGRHRSGVRLHRPRRRVRHAATDRGAVGPADVDLGGPRGSGPGQLAAAARPHGGGPSRRAGDAGPGGGPGRRGAVRSAGHGEPVHRHQGLPGHRRPAPRRAGATYAH